MRSSSRRMSRASRAVSRSPDLGGENLDAGVDRDLGVLLAELVLRIAQMGLGLVADERASDAHLPLDRGDGLAGDLADGPGEVEQALAGRAAELLDLRGDAALVVAGLLQVRLETLLVGRLLGERDVRGQVRLEFGFLGVGFAQPTSRASRRVGSGSWLQACRLSFRRRERGQGRRVGGPGQAGRPTFASFSWRSTAASTVRRARCRASYKLDGGEFGDAREPRAVDHVPGVHLAVAGPRLLHRDARAGAVLGTGFGGGFDQFGLLGDVSRREWRGRLGRWRVSRGRWRGSRGRCCRLGGRGGWCPWRRRGARGTTRGASAGSSWRCWRAGAPFAVSLARSKRPGEQRRSRTRRSTACAPQPRRRRGSGVALSAAKRAAAA